MGLNFDVIEVRDVNGKHKEILAKSSNGQYHIFYVSEVVALLDNKTYTFNGIKKFNNTISVSTKIPRVDITYRELYKLVGDIPIIFMSYKEFIKCCSDLVKSGNLKDSILKVNTISRYYYKKFMLELSKNEGYKKVCNSLEFSQRLNYEKLYLLNFFEIRKNIISLMFVNIAKEVCKLTAVRCNDFNSISKVINKLFLKYYNETKSVNDTLNILNLQFGSDFIKNNFEYVNSKGNDWNIDISSFNTKKIKSFTDNYISNENDLVLFITNRILNTMICNNCTVEEAYNYDKKFIQKAFNGLCEIDLRIPIGTPSLVFMDL